LCGRGTRPSRLASAALALVALLAACGPRDARFAPSSFDVHGIVAPRDVAVPSNASGGLSEYRGLYVSHPGVLSCCWIAPHATLLVRKHGPARKLVAGFWVPDIPRFANGQQVTLSLEGAAPVHWALPKGTQTSFALPIPAKLRDAKGLIPVTITSAIDYVPARDDVATHSLFVLLHLRAPHTSLDTRQLGVVLLYLYFA
jgi:hypothetical protein